MYESCTSSVKFIRKYFTLFDAVVNVTVFLILFSGCSLLVYTLDFCILILYFATLLYLLVLIGFFFLWILYTKSYHLQIDIIVTSSFPI